ncbi:OmpH family outer membrane protein [Wenyingzhuangia sp. IMCC45574]
MKQIKKTFLIAVIALGLTQVAQAQKVAHIDVKAVVEDMPETKKMNEDVAKKAKAYDTELKMKKNNLDAKMKKFGAEAPTLTPEINKSREEEVQADALRLQQFQRAAQQDLLKLENEHLRPIEKKVQEAIKAYAKANGIQYIFDTRTLIYFDGGVDISSAIKAKLGVPAKAAK